MTENSFDIMRLTEVNKDWRLLLYHIWAGTNGWRRHHRLQVSKNFILPHDKPSLVGGTAICCMEDVVFWISKQENDPQKLGRWSTVTFTGKNQLNTTLITAYCPVKGTLSGSVYSQPLVYMSSNSANIPLNISCPRQLFWHNLSELLNELISNGH